MLLLFVTLHVMGGYAYGEKPILNYLYPAGGVRGSTFQVTLGGSFEPWPPKVWVGGKGVLFTFETNQGKAMVEIELEADPGPRLLRLYNEEGASEPRLFVVGASREAIENEPNDHFQNPQATGELPVVINGRLDKNGDVDSFFVRMQSGQWLDAKLESYVLMGKLDAVLRLTATNGQQIAWNHDFGSLDPRLIWRASNDQDVVLQVFGFAYPANAAVRLSGGEGAVYRLHLKIADKQSLRSSNLLPETEPNNGADTAQVLELPTSVSGRISTGLDEDRFAVDIKKGEFLSALVRSYELGSLMDAWLRVEDRDGKELARNDDANSTADPRLDWRAPADGKYFVAIGSVTHRGGREFFYEMDLGLGEPDYHATAENSSVVIKPGSSEKLKLKIDFLRGFTNQLQVLARGLPEGITVTNTPVPADGGELELMLYAESNAPAANGPFEIVIRDVHEGSERSVPVEFTTRTVNNGVPSGYTKLLLERTDKLWLTVAPPVSETPASGDAK